MTQPAEKPRADGPSLINTTAASNAALLGNYMASLFASVEGGVNATATETAQSETVLTHPHTG